MDHPPLPLLVAYRLFGWRLGERYRNWTYDDITRRGYTFRQAIPVGLAVGALLAGVFAAVGSDPREAVAPVLGALVLSFFLRKVLRERALQQQGLNAQGEAVAGWYGDDAERQRRNLNGAVLLTALVVGGVVLIALRR